MKIGRSKLYSISINHITLITFILHHFQLQITYKLNTSTPKRKRLLNYHQMVYAFFYCFIVDDCVLINYLNLAKQLNPSLSKLCSGLQEHFSHMALSLGQ